MEKTNIVEGTITSFHGPVCAGKSKTLIEIAENYASVEAFQPSIHTRDGSFIKSRNGKQLKCKLVDKLDEAVASQSDLVVIDEYQHFNSEIFEKALIKFKEAHRTVIIAGLNTRHDLKFKRNFEILQKYSDKIVELYARCSICNKPTRFSYKLSGEKAIERIKLFHSTREPRCERCVS